MSGENNHVSLDLSGNQIDGIEAEWFEDREVLTHLVLSDNQLMTIDPAVFAPLAGHLETLHLDSNPLDPIPTCEDLDAILPNPEELELRMPMPEPVEMDELRELPNTGGTAPSNSAVILMLILRIAVISAATAMAMVTKRARSGSGA